MKYKHFTKEDRYYLSVLLKRGCSFREIAQELKKSPSSVSREIKRNKVQGHYYSDKSNHKAYVRRKYSKYQGMKIRNNKEIERFIWEKTQSNYDWSPESIAGRWNREHPRGIKIGHRVIYKYLYGTYGISLCKYLKSQRHRPKKRKIKKSIKEMIPNRIWIDLRPAIINTRVSFSNFEVDTMGRPRNASLETLAVCRERKTRKLFAVKVLRLKYAMEGFKKILKPYSDILNSVTFDNGVENTKHEELKTATYFCHPYSSWEKGGVENGIGVIRNYIPKKADLIYYSDEYIINFLNKINNKPMKCLNWLTPNEVFEKELQIARSKQPIITNLLNLPLRIY